MGIITKTSNQQHDPAARGETVGLSTMPSSLNPFLRKSFRHLTSEITDQRLATLEVRHSEDRELTGIARRFVERSFSADMITRSQSTEDRSVRQSDNTP